MGRDQKLERAWKDRNRRYEKSGLTIVEFCEQEGLVAHQFSWWRSELKRRAAKAGSPTRKRAKSKSVPPKKRGRPSKRQGSPRFLPVEVRSSGGTPSCVEVILDQPPRISVTRGFDADLLRDVIRVLETR